MNVKELIELYKDNTQPGLIQDICKHDYVPFEQQVERINAILDASLTTQAGMVTYDSAVNHLNLSMFALDTFTQLEIENMLEDYNLLHKYNLFSAIMNEISEEFHGFQALFFMKLEDRIRIANSLEGIVNRRIAPLCDSLHQWIAQASAKVTGLSEGEVSALLQGFRKEIHQPDGGQEQG